jgi:hypothetical protein
VLQLVCLWFIIVCANASKSQLFIYFHLFIFVLYCSFIGVFSNPTSGCWEPRPCSRNQRVVVCAHVRRAPWRHILLKPRRTCHQRLQWPHVLGRGDVDVANLACVSPRRRTRRAQVRASMASLLLPIVSKISWFDKLYMNFWQRQWQSISEHHTSRPTKELPNAAFFCVMPES